MSNYPDFTFDQLFEYSEPFISPKVDFQIEDVLLKKGEQYNEFNSAFQRGVNKELLLSFRGEKILVEKLDNGIHLFRGILLGS
jgi:hypothetical protein